MWTTIRILILGVLVVAGGALVYAAGDDQPSLDGAERADRIVVRKAARTLTLFDGARELKTYPVSIGAGNPGRKRREGDARTPEGDFTITGRNPGSVAFLSLRVSYPEPADVASAAAAGVPPGGDIMIHGLMNGYGWIGRLHRLRNWTEGCIAVTNPEMLEIWRAVPDGAAITIEP